MAMTLRLIDLSLRCAFALLPLLLSVQTHGDSEPVKQKFHLNEKSENEIGYAQAVKVGNIVYISGSVGAGPMPHAIHDAYEEIKKTLAAYGLTFQSVAKENVYSTQLDEFIKHKDLRRAYYSEDFPAATWVQVARLYVPELVLEVEVTAVIPTVTSESEKR
jgi:2-iminobutanoate/2-iminopropanoate deaminase